MRLHPQDVLPCITAQRSIPSHPDHSLGHARMGTCHAMPVHYSMLTSAAWPCLPQDGAPCRNPVNKDICAYCKYHLSAAYKRTKTTRPELQQLGVLRMPPGGGLSHSCSSGAAADNTRNHTMHLLLVTCCW